MTKRQRQQKAFELAGTIIALTLGKDVEMTIIVREPGEDDGNITLRSSIETPENLAKLLYRVADRLTTTRRKTALQENADTSATEPCVSSVMWWSAARAIHLHSRPAEILDTRAAEGQAAARCGWAAYQGKGQHGRCSVASWERMQSAAVAPIRRRRRGSAIFKARRPKNVEPRWLIAAESL